jgi:type IV pilus assembly protein PilE
MDPLMTEGYPLASAPRRARGATPNGVPRRAHAGFSAIEVLIVVAIVGILARIAIPTYLAYVQRGKVSEAVSALGDGRVQAEQFFNDNLTYVGMPCPIATKYFTITCNPPPPTISTYQITATGIADLSSFTYTINQANARSTTSPWGNGACWIMRSGDTC